MPPVRLFDIPAGVAGTRETLAYMRALVRAETGAPLVRALAAEMAAVAGPGAETRAGVLRHWLAEVVVFTRDPPRLELLVAPTVQLTTIRATGTTSGDCDDVAVLGATLALAMGLRARFVVLGRTQFEHVFTAVGDGRTWWELDTTRPFQAVPAAWQHRVLTVEV